MARQSWGVVVALVMAFGAGCTPIPIAKPGACPKEPEPAADKHADERVTVGCDGQLQICKKKEEPPTLLEWAVCKEEEEEKEEEKKEDEEEKDKPEKPKNGTMGEGEAGAAKDAGNGAEDEKCDKPKAPVCWYRESRAEHRAKIKQQPLVSDRPDFTEASTTVGRGIIQLEAGYTFTRDRDLVGTRTNNHAYPEMLFRIGMFADWFELRLAQNFASENTREAELEITDSVGGAEDLYVGTKIALTEQKSYLPEVAVILQMTLPTGHDDFTAKQILPGVNMLYGWDLIEDCLSLGGSTQANRNVDDMDHFYVELAQSLTVGYSLTSKLGAYTEWFAFFPTGSIDPLIGPQYYLDGGFTYQVTYDFQLDIRAGVGLNRHADNFFTGAGFVVRY